MDIQVALKWKSIGEWPKHERWTRTQLETHEAEALLCLRDYAYARSPFYQRFHKGLTDRPLEELPVLTEAMAMENFDDLATDKTVHLEDVRAHSAGDQEGRQYSKRYWVAITSGRTGHPRIFLFNRDEWMSTYSP